MTVLQVREIQGGYGDLRVVQSVGLDVVAGSVTVLIGRNGAGKTTALRLITGLNRLHGGSVMVEGVEVGRMRAERRVTAGLGLVQEGKRIFKDLTVEENLVVGTHSLRMGRAARLREVRATLDRFEILSTRRNVRSAQLSGGQQQILAIAQALIARPKVLILDEPSTGLAPSVVKDVLEIVGDLRRQGMGVLLVEQVVDFALAVADSVVVMDLGRTTFSAAPDDPRLREAIDHAYLGDTARADE